MDKSKYKFRLFFFQITLLSLIKILAVNVVLLTTCFSAYAEEREEHAMINITAGQIGFLDDLDGPQRYGLEYRFKSFSGPRGFRLIPAIGFATSKNGAKFIYIDLKHDFYLGDRWMLIPSFGLGAFKNSEEINLGSKLEFRSGIEIAYQFRNKIRAGVAIFHLSNGGIANRNPGTEALVFSLCFPIKN